MASDAVLGALGAWTSPDCTSFEAGFDGVVSSAAQAGDGRSTIELVSTAWVARGFPAGRGATTDVQLLVTEDGTAAIVEADIYVNFEEHSFVFGAPDGERLDFRAVVTHEVGHLLGLAHPCGELDAPVCDGTQVESALNPEYGGVRALSADDADGVCALYPVASCAPGCEDGAVCIQGVCERACTSPECSPSYCEGADCPGAVVCATDEDCRLGACSCLGPSEGTCVQAGATGTTCGSGDDCASLLCLESLQLHRRVCTTSCASDADCGDAQRCALLDGRKVCAPEERMTPNCSALAGGSGHHSGWTAGFLSAVTVLLALFARKREPS